MLELPFAASREGSLLHIRNAQRFDANENSLVLPIGMALNKTISENNPGSNRIKDVFDSHGGER